MGEFTQLLREIETGGRPGADLFVLVYDDLRRLAGSKLAAKNGDQQTLRPTALVHEAFVRLFEGETPQFANRRHFFGIAAEAMRRIIVENVRRRKSEKHGGGVFHFELSEGTHGKSADFDQIMDVNAALDLLAQVDAESAEIVKMRYFAGLEISECAEILGISESTVKRQWKFAKVWLHQKLAQVHPPAQA